MKTELRIQLLSDCSMVQFYYIWYHFLLTGKITFGIEIVWEECISLQIIHVSVHVSTIVIKDLTWPRSCPPRPYWRGWSWARSSCRGTPPWRTSWSRRPGWWPTRWRTPAGPSCTRCTGPGATGGLCSWSPDTASSSGLCTTTQMNWNTKLSVKEL